MALAIDDNFGGSIDVNDIFLERLLMMGVKMPEGKSSWEVTSEDLLKQVNLVTKESGKLNLKDRMLCQLIYLREHAYFMGVNESWCAKKDGREEKKYSVEDVINSWNHDLHPDFGVVYADHFNENYIKHRGNSVDELSLEQLYFVKSVVEEKHSPLDVML